MPGLLKDRPDTPKPPEQGVPTRASRAPPPEVVMDPNPGQPMPDIYVRRNVRPYWPVVDGILQPVPAQGLLGRRGGFKRFNGGRFKARGSRFRGSEHQTPATVTNNQGDFN